MIALKSLSSTPDHEHYLLTRDRAHYLHPNSLFHFSLVEHGHNLVTQAVKNLPAIQDTRVQSLSWENPLEKEMATHSSILAWRIPWTEEPGRLQSMGSQRVRYDWVTNTLHDISGAQDCWWKVISLSTWNIWFSSPLASIAAEKKSVVSLTVNLLCNSSFLSGTFKIAFCF